MARLRLFANLREAAGTASADVPGATVGEVLERAAADYGPAFAGGLAAAKVWVNGDPAGAATPVGEDDEVALIPPVSGGETVAATPDLTTLLVGAALVATLVIGNFTSAPWFAFAVVSAALAWVWDLAATATSRHVPLNVFPPMLGAAIAVNGAYGWGFSGFALGVTLAVMVALAWGVFDRRQRSIEAIAVTAAATLVVGLGSGALMLVRLRTEQETLAFIVIAVVAGVASWASGRFRETVPWMDRNVAVGLAGVLTGIIASLFTDHISVAVGLLAGAAAAAGLLAGRTFGTLARTGEISHTERPPGVLEPFDGAVLAAAMFWLAIALFS